MKRSAILCIAATFLLQSCLMEDMRAPQSVFEVADVTVPADSAASYGTGTGTVTAYVSVRSTESWSAIVCDSNLSSWLEIASPDYSNPSGADVTQKLKLVCEDNDSYSPRSAKLRFAAKSGKTREITVTQEAKSDRIMVDGDSSFSLAAEIESTIKVKLLSNSDWTAELDSLSSTCMAKISPTTGNGDAIVSITPSSNYSTSTAVAVIRFSVPGDTVRVSITREADQPFMGAYPVNLSQNKMPADTSGVLIFNCNSQWTAEVLESSIGNFALDTLRGEGGMETELPFTMSANEGRETLYAKVKLSLSSDPGKNVTLTVVQRAGFTLYLDFTEVTDENSCPLQPMEDKYPQIPFTESDAASLNNSEGEPYSYLFTSTEGSKYIFEIKNSLFNVYGYYGTKGVSDGYLRLSQGYLKFPAVEGYRLAYVEFKTAATNKKFCIAADPEGTEIIGKTQVVAKEATVSWDFENTEYGKSYYEVVLLTKSRQHDLKLLYVK